MAAALHVSFPSFNWSHFLTAVSQLQSSRVAEMIIMGQAGSVVSSVLITTCILPGGGSFIIRTLHCTRLPQLSHIKFIHVAYDSRHTGLQVSSHSTVLWTLPVHTHGGPAEPQGQEVELPLHLVCDHLGHAAGAPPSRPGFTEPDGRWVVTSRSNKEDYG